MDDDEFSFEFGSDLRDGFYDFIEGNGKDLDIPSPLEEDVKLIDFEQSLDDDVQQDVKFKPPPPNQTNNNNFVQNFNPNPQYLKFIQSQSINQFQNVQQIMNQPKQFNQFFQQTLPQNYTPKFLTLIDGFVNPVKDRVPGGKDNVKYPLPRQIVELSIPMQYRGRVDPTKLTIQAILVGFDKKTQKKMNLAVLNTRRFTNMNGKMVAIFDNLIVKFSSHLYGINGKLYLQFKLLNPSNNVIDTIESQGFLTITKRGLEKQIERKKKKISKLGVNQSANECTPPIGLTSGNLLVKIHGEGFLASPLLHSFVTFGIRKCREIISIKRDLIICETPENNAGMVNVNVSLDGKSYVASKAKFLYVAPNDQNGLNELLKYMVNPKNFFSKNQSNQFGGSNFLNNKLANQNEFLNFVTGQTSDFRGNNIIHHSACRGYFELIYVCFAKYKKKVDVDSRDNFGRTPLFWSIFSGFEEVSKLLVKIGSQLHIKDDFGDTILHVASQENVCYSLKNFVFWLLKNDDHKSTSADLITSLLIQKNDYGETPLDCAQSKSMENLLNSLKEICERRKKEAIGTQIQIRSGVNIGKIVDEKVENPKSYIIISDNKIEILYSKNSRATILNSQLAFIILAKNENRVEFTLRKPPIIEKWVNKTWIRSENDMMLSLSFFIKMKSPELHKMHFLITKRENLYQFKNWAFVYRSSKAVKKKKKIEMNTDHVLHDKISQFMNKKIERESKGEIV